MNSLIDDYLVGDVTGTRYRIDDNGNILRDFSKIKVTLNLDDIVKN